MNAHTSFPKSADAASLEIRVSESDFFWPLAIIGGLLLLVCIAGTHYAVDAFNRSSAIREQILAQNGIEQRVEEVAKMVVPQAMWDDAVAYLDNSFDQSWASENIGKFLHNADHFDQSFVVDAKDQPIFASREGTALPTSAWQGMFKQAAPVLQKVRRLEHKRGIIRRLAEGELISRALQASALKIVDGKLAVVTATLVQPDFGKSMPLGAQAPIVVTSMVIDQNFLEVFARRYMLDGLHVVSLGEQIPDGEVSIPAKDELGTTIAHFSWRPLDPGYVMLGSFLGPLSLALLLLATVAFFQLRRIHLAARSLLDSQAFCGVDYNRFSKRWGDTPPVRSHG